VSRVPEGAMIAMARSMLKNEPLSKRIDESRFFRYNGFNPMMPDDEEE